MRRVSLMLFIPLAASDGALAVPLVPLSPNGTVFPAGAQRFIETGAALRIASEPISFSTETTASVFGLTAAQISTTTATTCPSGSTECVVAVNTIIDVPDTDSGSTGTFFPGPFTLTVIEPFIVSTQTLNGIETESVTESAATIFTHTETDCPAGTKSTDCVVEVNTVLLLPAPTADGFPVTFTEVTPSSAYSVAVSSFAPVARPNSATPAASVGESSPTADAAAHKQSRKHTQILLGGLLGGLSLVGIIVAILFMFRRRRLQTTKPGVQPDFQSLFSLEAPHPAEFEGFVSNATSQRASVPVSTVDHGRFEKALVRRVNLQQQVHRIEAEIAELQRVTTRFRVTNPGTEAVGDYLNTEVTATAQMAALRARVQELENERDAMWVGEAPPGYFDQ
ncbi:hypothetical protein DFH06DRAFT_1297609 [Mycena polygramma]|nr:hypothetical protein DFH06DRAFT_1297609 [Mycena polygramma]